MNICVVNNGNIGMDQMWIKALKKKKIAHYLVDIEKHNWLESILKQKCDFIVAVPHGTVSYKKQLFDERIYILKYLLNFPIYPSYEELIVYENKRMLSYWLKAFKFPHPKTDIFYSYEEALSFLSNVEFPIVLKSNIGAAASGVHIVKNWNQAKRLIKRTFKGGGLPRRRGPNFNKKNVYKNIFSKLSDLDFVRKKIQYYKEIQEDRDKRSLLFQEYIQHDFEWKNVRIGNSFFSHKKIVKDGAASGTGIKIFADPPKSLLEFVKEVTDKRNFSSVSVDIFETGKNQYLINEIQTYFGQPYSYLMAIDDQPGRYLNCNGEWTFEIGDFNTNHSCDLRLEHALDMFSHNELR